VQLRVNLRDQSLVETCGAKWIFGSVKGCRVENLTRLLSSCVLEVVVVGFDVGDISRIPRDHTSLAWHWGLKKIIRRYENKKRWELTLLYISL